MDIAKTYNSPLLNEFMGESFFFIVWKVVWIYCTKLYIVHNDKMNWTKYTNCIKNGTSVFHSFLYVCKWHCRLCKLFKEFALVKLLGENVKGITISYIVQITHNTNWILTIYYYAKAQIILLYTIRWLYCVYYFDRNRKFGLWACSFHICFKFAFNHMIGCTRTSNNSIHTQNKYERKMDCYQGSWNQHSYKL